MSSSADRSGRGRGRSAVCPASHARDREHSAHAVDVDMSASAPDGSASDRRGNASARRTGARCTAVGDRATREPHRTRSRTPTSPGPSVAAPGNVWRQLANGLDENSLAGANMVRLHTDLRVASALLRHHESPADNTTRTALLTLSMRRAGVVADLVLVFRRSAEPAQGANPCTNRAQDVPARADINQHEPDDLSRSASSERTSWTLMDPPDRSGAT